MTATDTYLGLRAFVDELARCGLEHCATSPGSRCTPLVLNLARDGRIRCWSHLDERCGAFFALGAAKATGRPAAMVCTSGTAAANYLPAVIEAYEARVPLLVLTADRPPELRDAGAGQTIDQVKLYGRHAVWYLGVDEAPATPERMRFLRRLACQAYLTAAEQRRPVHLNFALREPLTLDEPLPDDEPGGGGRPDGRPWVTRTTAPRAWPAALLGELEARPKALFVAGRLEDSSGPALAHLAFRMRVPLLAEPTSNARTGEAIAHYDLHLRDPAWPHVPDLVVRFGDLPTSKPLRQWLARLPDSTRQIAVGAEWRDPAGAVEALLDADPGATARALEAEAVPQAPDGWIDAWLGADERARHVLQELAIDSTEPGAVARVWGRLPPEATLLVASSMPIRDLEITAVSLARPARVLANRGANGIDGLVSTAYGIAAATGGPTVLLTGDVALVHDIGGLLAGRRLGLDLVIVVLNNDGGGIFHFLPVGGERDVFEEHVATPHGLDLAQAAALFGHRHELVGDVFDAVGRALEAGGTTILEVRTEREANRELHRRIEAAMMSP